MGNDKGWPAIKYEQVPWQLPADLSIPRNRRARHAGPYSAAIPALIASIKQIPLSMSTAALVDEASTEIARFDSEFGADISPYAALLLRSESASSSQIENLTASSKAVVLAELGDLRRHNASLIVANTRSMETAIALANNIDEQAMLDMHEALMGASRPDWAGQWRNEQVWIGGSSFGPHDAHYIPPRHERLAKAVADLVAFMRRDDIPPLVQATIAHAQFETIHPFADGNGRTGRSLIHSLLRAKRLTRSVTVPVSAGLLADTETYFDALTAYRNGSPEEIVALLANASFLALNNGRQLVAELAAIKANWTDRITTRKGASAWLLADLLVRQPIVDSPLVQRELKLAATNANAAIDHLEVKGILREVTGKFRNRKWAAQEVLVALDDFSKRAGRRKHG